MPHSSLLYLALAGLIFFAAHLVSTTTGFGSNVLGLPLLALVVGLEPGKQSLIVLGALLYTYMTLRWWKRVNRRELLFVAIVAGVGLIAGMMIATKLDRRISTILLAVFVIAVGLRGLLNIAPNYRAPMWISKILLFLGGVIHGAFTTGGPVLTVYCQRAMPHKSTFRATLAVMWLLLAIMLMAGWTIGGTWDVQTPRVSLIGLPFMIGGLVAGEYLHHRVDERGFRAAVNLTLIAIGFVLLFLPMK
jgi:uncharacterized membrane protein YfcA